MRALAVALVSGLLVVGAAAANAPREPSWKSLHRALHLPRVSAGASCPVTTLRPVRLANDEVRPLAGAGPAYPILNGVYLDFYWPPLSSQPDFYGTGWSVNKVMWVVASRYSGRVLVRGRQIDGANFSRVIVFKARVIPPPP